MFLASQRYQPQTNEANYINLNAEVIEGILVVQGDWTQKWARMLVETGKAFVDPSAVMTQMRADSDFWSLPKWTTSQPNWLHSSEEALPIRIEHCQNTKFSRIIIIIINPLTARVDGAPQIILQPVFSIIPCSPQFPPFFFPVLLWKTKQTRNAYLGL